MSNLKYFLISILIPSMASLLSHADDRRFKAKPWACAFYDTANAYAAIGYGSTESVARDQVQQNCIRQMPHNVNCSTYATCESQNQEHNEAWVCTVFGPIAWEGRGASKVQAGYMAYETCVTLTPENHRAECTQPLDKNCLPFW